MHKIIVCATALLISINSVAAKPTSFTLGDLIGPALDLITNQPNTAIQANQPTLSSSLPKTADACCGDDVSLSFDLHPQIANTAWYVDDYILSLINANCINHPEILTGSYVAANMELLSALIKTLMNTITVGTTHKLLITLLVNAENGSFDQPNHYVGIAIILNDQGGIAEIQYIDPKGNNINADLAQHLCNQLSIANQQIRQVFDHQSHPQADDDSNNCGPYLVQAFLNLTNDQFYVTNLDPKQLRQSQAKNIQNPLPAMPAVVIAAPLGQSSLKSAMLNSHPHIEQQSANSANNKKYLEKDCFKHIADGRALNAQQPKLEAELDSLINDNLGLTREQFARLVSQQTHLTEPKRQDLLNLHSYRKKKNCDDANNAMRAELVANATILINTSSPLVDQFDLLISQNIELNHKQFKQLLDHLNLSKEEYDAALSLYAYKKRQFYTTAQTKRRAAPATAVKATTRPKLHLTSEVDNLINANLALDRDQFQQLLVQQLGLSQDKHNAILSVHAYKKRQAHAAADSALLLAYGKIIADQPELVAQFDALMAEHPGIDHATFKQLVTELKSKQQDALLALYVYKQTQPEKQQVAANSITQIQTITAPNAELKTYCLKLLEDNPGISVKQFKNLPGYLILAPDERQYAFSLKQRSLKEELLAKASLSSLKK